MARSPKAAQYERTARLRKVYDVQANMLGWSKLDVMAAYLTDEDELIVFDKEERRLSGNAIPLPAEIENARTQTIVEPRDVPSSEIGQRWQRARPGLAEALAEGGLLDLSTAGHPQALSAAEALAASALRLVQVLREVDGPDWREQIGLGA